MNLVSFALRPQLLIAVVCSYPDMVFFQFPDDNIKWFGEHKGSWAWMHGVLYAALPPALLHGMSG